MPSAPEILSEAVEHALGAPALIRPCTDPKFGDYQANGVMAAAKRLNENPRTLAEKIISQLDVSGICEPPTVAGAGFINFRLRPAFVAEQITAAARDERLGVPRVAGHKTVVIDFSSPNVAKPMHVGHIRSTIIGDCLARVMRFLGHRVITDNHIGDWGTQFGKLLVGWKSDLNRAGLDRDAIGEMERLYKLERAFGRKLKHTSKEEAKSFLESARHELVKLQSGDEENLRHWREMIDRSQRQFDDIYERLGVKFDHTLGESFYNDRLKSLVDELVTKGIARESKGAIVIFFDDVPQLKKHPAIIRKSDGAFNYATTDLATLEYRLQTWHPDQIIYVTDGRQQLHFQQVFTAFRRWQVEAKMNLKHVWFGSILGEDGKPFKTRSGETVKLGALLDEAEKLAFALVTKKNHDLPFDTRKQIAHVVGIGAVKYADLSQNRTTDYVFSWSKMLAMTGNTAPYMQYAYVRVQSIFRKAGGAAATAAPINLEHPAELDLAKHLLRFAETLQSVAEDDKPNWLTSYLYDLAGKFSVFYDNCPVLQSAEPTRASRLQLCGLTAGVMKQGLNLLGIDVIEQM